MMKFSEEKGPIKELLGTSIFSNHGKCQPPPPLFFFLAITSYKNDQLLIQSQLNLPYISQELHLLMVLAVT